MIKKLFNESIIINIFLFLLIIPIFNYASAQTCPNIPISNNSIAGNITISESGTYKVWSRIIAPDTTNNSFYLQIDNNCVINIGDAAAIPANNLIWVDYQEAQSTNKVLVNLGSGSHTIKITEREGGVGVDKIFFTKDMACVPSGTGNNCPLPTSTPSPTITPTAIPTPIPTLTPSPTPIQIANGLNAVYYNNKDFTGSTVTRIDPAINFNWGTGSPSTSISSNTFSVVWTGYVVPLYSQTYTFYTRTDDGARLYINGQRIINRWTDQTATEVSGSIPLKAGQKYSIRMEYYENQNSAVAELRWKSYSQTKQIIPSSRLSTN